MREFRGVSQKVKQDRLYVGIDISKESHVAVIQYPDGSQSRGIPFSNRREGFWILCREIESASGRTGISEVTIAIEPTGHYGMALSHYLHRKGYHLVIVQPKHTKRSKEVWDNSPRKVDTGDSRLIAWLVSQGRSLSYIHREGAYLELHHRVQRRESLVKERSQIKNRIHRILDITFPEFSGLFSSPFVKTAIALMKSFPMPEDLLRTAPSQILEQVKAASHGRFRQGFVDRLLHEAAHSIGITDGLLSIKEDLMDLIERYEELEGKIAELEHSFHTLLDRCPEVSLLLSVPGIGPITAAYILAETGPLSAYRNAESFYKIAGLNLYEISSGKQKGRRHISKRGRSLLRKTLYLAAVRMAKKTEVFYPTYQRLTEENNVEKVKALIALARKLLRVIFALVRDDKEFSLDYEGRYRWIQAA